MTAEEPQYRLVVYAAERVDGPPVAPGTVAEALGRSPAATTEMLQRLDDRGVVDYEPYEGATLTESGRSLARREFETYVTMVRFLREVLDIDEPALARQLAATIRPTVADRLDATLLEDRDSEVDPASLLGAPPSPRG